MNCRSAAIVVLGCALSACAVGAQAQEAAAVSTTSGVVVVQKADGSVRSLAPGAMVQSGDVITTQPNSTARVKFTDGGEVTLSANSQLKIDAYSFNSAAPQADNLVMRLLKGGMRSITGFISRRGNRDAYRLQTATATIGIRGTDYIARLCEGDECAQEAAKTPPGARAVAPEIVARVALLSGEAVALDKAGGARALGVGSAIYQGDLIETRARSHALLVFLDEGRVTLQPETRFMVERFRYEPARPEQGSSVLRLLRGGLRALTGLIAKRRPENYEVQTMVATIGIRGTGFDASCTGPCVDEAGLASPETKPKPLTSSDEKLGGLFVYTWEGELEVRNPAGAQVAVLGQTVRVTARDRGPVLWPDVPQFMRDAPGPRPDGIKIDLQQLFGAADQNDRGLYVLVKEGSIQLVQDGRTLQLERGESAFAGFAGELYRLRIEPRPLYDLRNIVDPPRTKPGDTICTF